MLSKELMEAISSTCDVEPIEEGGRQPLWHNLAKADDSLASAYTSLVDFKMSLDKFHEIPKDLMPAYNATMKAMDKVGKVRQETYNLRMQARRLSRGF